MRVLLQGAATEPLQEMFEQGALDKVQELLTGEDLNNLQRMRDVAPASLAVGLLFGGGEVLAGRMAGGEAQATSQEALPPQAAQEAPGAIQAPEAAEGPSGQQTVVYERPGGNRIQVRTSAAGHAEVERAMREEAAQPEPERPPTQSRELDIERDLPEPQPSAAPSAAAGPIEPADL